MSVVELSVIIATRSHGKFEMYSYVTEELRYIFLFHFY